MPTYQYACTNPDCGNRFELVQSFSDPAASSCPVCAGNVRKVFSAVGVVFKGSGFYRTDSRAEAKSAKASAKSDAGTKSSSSDGSSSASPASSGSKDSSGANGSGGSSSSSSGSSSSGSSSTSGVAAASA